MMPNLLWLHGDPECESAFSADCESAFSAAGAVDEPHSASLFGSGNDRMSKLGGGIGEGGPYVFALDTRKIVQDLIFGRAARQHAQDIGDADPHPANAGMSAALLGARCNSGEQGLRHKNNLSGLRGCDQSERYAGDVGQTGFRACAELRGSTPCRRPISLWMTI